MSDNLLKNAIEKIAEMAAPTIREINGAAWTSKELRPLPVLEDEPKQYTVNTLEGLVDLIKREGIKYAFEEKPLFVVVRSPELVEVDSAWREGRGTEFLRLHLYQAKTDVPCFTMGFRPLEERIIQLRSQCADAGDRARLLDLLSSVRRDEGVSSLDNGVSQTVVATQGTSLKTREELPPYVTLQPYRTFLEVDQPESQFLLRVNQEFQVGLFEADGGAWKLEAKRRIRAWLADALKSEVEDGRAVVTI